MPGNNIYSQGRHSEIRGEGFNYRAVGFSLRRRLFDGNKIMVVVYFLNFFFLGVRLCLNKNFHLFHLMANCPQAAEISCPNLYLWENLTPISLRMLLKFSVLSGVDA